MRGDGGGVSGPTILDVMAKPTSIENIHESCFRSWTILEYVDRLLAEGVPAASVRSIIAELRDLPALDVQARAGR